jgi:hypothetical protein
MARITFLVALMLLLTLAPVFAARLNVTVVPIKAEILPGETAVFDVLIENMETSSVDLKYSFSEDPSWSIITTPIYHQNSIKIAPRDIAVTTIQITPTATVPNGRRYTYPAQLRSNTENDTQIVGLELFLKNPLRDYNYLPVVEIDADLDSDLDPRKVGTLTLNLRNYNPLNISKLIIDLNTSVNPANDQHLVLTLGGLERRKMEVTLSYDPLQPPVKDYIRVSAYIPDRNATIEPSIKELQLLPYNEVTREKTQKDSFMKTTIMLYYFNNGNVNKIEHIRVPTSLFKDIFTQTNPKATTIREAGVRYMSWDFDLVPQETRSVQISINYKPLFIFVAVALVVIILYFVFRSPVVIRKVVTNLQKEEHEVSRVKVLIHVRNRSGRIIENVEVIDRLPHIAMLENEFPVGTMQPQKVIRHEHKGTFVKWVIPGLEAYEERIISYRMNSKLPIIGGLMLKPTIVKYKNKMGGVSKSYSNRISS